MSLEDADAGAQPRLLSVVWGATLQGVATMYQAAGGLHARAGCLSGHSGAGSLLFGIFTVLSASHPRLFVSLPQVS